MIRSRLFISIGLFIATLALYAPCSGFNFVDYDDVPYVTDNPHIRDGLTAATIRWAFTSGYEANWHPLTWMSHAIDVQLFGYDAAGHHIVNVLLHSIDGVLLFWFLVVATGQTWSAALVALLFAVHPLHVESVAWVAERKDVLSACFGLIALLAFTIYVKRGARQWYWLSILAFAMGLCAKPMLVTLPIVLLLVNWWPLRRFSTEKSATINFGKTLQRVIAEMLPLVILAAASCVVTVWAQQIGGSVASVEKVPPIWRTANAADSIIQYLRQTIWPAGLSVFYPNPYLSAATLNIPLLVGCGLLLLAITAYVVWRTRSRPYLLFGWVWFVIMLIPVLGFVQVGNQARADRYTYLPSIGFFVAVVWWGAAVADRYKRARPAIISAAVVACALFTVVAHLQINYWQSTVTLFEHAVDLDHDNGLAYSQLGMAYAMRGDAERAISAGEKAVALYDKVADRWRNDPNAPTVFNRTNLASFYIQNQQVEQAMRVYKDAVALSPTHLDARIGYGMTLHALHRDDEAIAQFETAMQQHPNDLTPDHRIGTMLLEQRQFEPAIKWLRSAVDKDRSSVESLSPLAWTLATCPDAALRKPTEAMALAGEAVMRSEGRDPIVINTLAAATAESGHLPKALILSHEAIRVAKSVGMNDEAESFEVQLEVYQSGRTLTQIQSQNPDAETRP